MAGAVQSFKGEDLERIRQVCLHSTYAFAKFICGFHDLDPEFHEAMAAWIQKPTQNKLGMAPRGHLKSTIWTVADSLRRVTADPSLQILIINEKADNIIKWVGIMQNVVMSEYYQALFPEVVPDTRKVRWNALQLELKRKTPKPQPCIEGQGITSALASNHYDIIKADDLVSDEASTSPTVMEDAVTKRKRFPSLLINQATSQIHDICTRWGPNDPANWVMKNVKDVDILKLGVWKSPGVPWWPKFFPPEKLEEMRQQYGPRDWALLYLNEIVGDGASHFDPGLLRYWTMETDAEGKEVFVLETPLGNKRIPKDDCLGYQVIDAGLSPESKDARTANVVGFLTPPTETTPFDYIIVEAKATHSTPAEVLVEAKASYDRWNPLYAAIETFGGHQAFFGWLCSAYPDMRIRELKKDFSRSAKVKRINGFWGSFPNQGRVYVHRTQTDMLDELVAFPNGFTVDLLDAAGYLPTVGAPPSLKKPEKFRRHGVSDFDLSDYDPEELSQQVSEGSSRLTGY